MALPQDSSSLGTHTIPQKLSLRSEAVLRLLGDNQRAILDLLIESGRPMSASELTERLGGDSEAERRLIRSCLHRLSDRGFVELWKQKRPVERDYDTTGHVGGISREWFPEQPGTRRSRRSVLLECLMAALPGDRIEVTVVDGTSMRIGLSEPGMDLDKVKVFLPDGSRLTKAKARKLADEVRGRALLRSAVTIREPDDLPRSYEEALGRQLRKVRIQRGLTLIAVSKASHGEFKLSALGNYERGERDISVIRLKRLADLYGVSVDQLLPETYPTGDER